MRVIASEQDLAEGVAHLTRVEPRFEAFVAAGAWPALRRRPPGFAALLGIMAQQQVSTASGRAIMARLEAAGATTPKAVLARDEDGLRALGLSRPKARYARALAEAVRDGRVCFDRQTSLPVDAAIAELTAVVGIGRWTAEIYQMSCEGRPDLLPTGDLALREAARLLTGAAERPSEPALAEIAAPWSPWRSVAARLLWAYYRIAKGRDGAA